MTDWLVLTATLPTHPSALRVRVWRALKATGAGTLRDGVYLLPAAAPSAAALWALQASISEAGADAHMLALAARDKAQEQSFRALFDRSELYAELLESIKDAHRALKTLSEAELRKQMRGLEQQLQALQLSDFFPAKAGEAAAQAMSALRREIELLLSPHEPQAHSAPIEALALADFQAKTWATRQRPWVDRLATAWLIQRFIDKSPRFIWLADAGHCPKTALGYDFDGARFSHIGDKVTFEVVAHSFGLGGDPALQRVAELVHYLDVGGIPVDAAPGFELLVRGLQIQQPQDDALLAAAVQLFDTLYAAEEGRP